MDAVETGKFDYWQQVLEDTGNTVCGRHPIGVVMAAIEAIEDTSENENEKVDGREDGSGKRRFRFVRYERSTHVHSVRDSSVSYCSAFVVF
jgi:predicted class III extradiol MEMO1 family dioxygenase